MPAADDSAETIGPVEIALVVCGGATRQLLALAGEVGEIMSDRLQAELPSFDWRITSFEVVKPDLAAPVEPVALISDPEIQARARGCDFTLIVTDQDLAAHYKPFAFGAPSRATASAVASTFRLADIGEVERVPARLAGLCLHLFGRLNGLDDSRNARSFAAEVAQASDLDDRDHLADAERAELRESLARVADPRVEEQAGGTRHVLGFYLRALRETRWEMLGAVARAEPWLFPLRLSRLTTAALSTLLVLMMTAEAWDVALRQPAWLVSSLSLVALVGTSSFVLVRQQLLIRRAEGGLTERRVLANASTVAVVLLGFLTTYLLLFAVTGGFALLIFDPELVGSWAAATEEPVGRRHYLLMSGFVACLGIVIGALGASFEARSHFRHVAFVDEEI